MMTSIYALKGRQGRLETFTITLKARQLKALIGDVRQKERRRMDPELARLYEVVQRKTAGSRARDIENYARARLSPKSTVVGGFPALTLLSCDPIENKTVIEGSNVVQATLDPSEFVNRVVVGDGLGRSSGVENLIEKARDRDTPEAERQEIVELLGELDLTLMIFAPPKGEMPERDMQQLFHDFNFYQKSMPAAQAMSRDHSDPYINFADRLGKECTSVVDYGGVEYGRASLGGKSSALVTEVDLVRMVRGALEGAPWQDAKGAPDKPNLTESSEATLFANVSAFLDGFREGMGEEQWADRYSVHRAGVGWGATGLVINTVLFDKKLDPYGAGRMVGKSIEWSRAAPVWDSIMYLPEVEEGEEPPVRRTFNAEGTSSKGNRQFIAGVMLKALGIDTKKAA